MIYFNNNNQEIRFRTNITNAIDGLMLIEPGFGVGMFMEQAVRDSIYTNMYFFNGNGVPEFSIPKLNKFKLVYNNPELKIFKVDFS